MGERGKERMRERKRGRRIDSERGSYLLHIKNSFSLLLFHCVVLLVLLQSILDNTPVYQRKQKKRKVN